MVVQTGSKLLEILDDYSPRPTDYFRHGADRIAASINMLPPGTGTVLELGCDSHFTLALALLTNYVPLPQNSPSPIAAPENVDNPTITFTRNDGRAVPFTRNLFNVENGRYPLDDESVDGVLCCELLEHLFSDPAWMLQEANRVLKPGGWLLLTTPNLTSYHAIRRATQGIHPMEHSQYFAKEVGPRLMVQHTREYGYWEVVELLQASGFSIERSETQSFTRTEQLGIWDYLLLIPALILYNCLRLRHPKHMLMRYRRPHTLILARKSGSPTARYPKFLYWQ